MSKTKALDKLSTTQRKTLRTLEKFIEDQGYPPTVEELSGKLQMTKSSVHGCLEKLISKGFLRKVPGKARGLEIVRSQQTTVIDIVAVPLLGTVPAGIPISSEEILSGHVYVQSNVIGSDMCFALSVVGDSMRDAEICDGDVVIVRQQPIAEHGDIVVASVDGEVTVKRLCVQDRMIQLLPENRKFEPIAIRSNTELKVLGKVIATRRLVRGSEAGIGA